ncbi:UNVERIFIED_CONTAM: hypothetical protein FKN15_050264 [Acipenser sinensis]
MRKVMEDMEFMEKKQQRLEKINLLLFPERERIRAEHEDAIDTLNNKLSEKATKQIILNETYNKMQDLKEQLVNVNNAFEDLEQDMTRERMDFAESKKKLESNVAETEGQIQNQKAENAKKIKELRFAGAELFDKEEEISEKQKCIQRLQKSIDQLKATSVQRRSQLAQEQKMGEQQTNQNENLDEELTALTEGFKIESQALCDKIVQVDEEMRQVEEINLVHQQMILSQTENFQAVRAREDVVLAFHMDDTKLLEASEHALEEKLENVAKLKMEIKEIDEEKKRLEESNEINMEMHRRKLDELKEQLVKEQKKRLLFEVKQEDLSNELERWKHAHTEYIEEINTNIELNKNKCAELIDEHTSLQLDNIKMNEETENLQKAIHKTEKRYTIMEESLTADISNIVSEVKLIKENLLQKEKQLVISHKVLQQVEAENEAERCNYEEIKKQTTELKSRKNNLELSIDQLKAETKCILKAKEALKAELNAMNAKHFQQLKNQAAAINKTEECIYKSGSMLEQINMENSRLHLCNAKMKEDIYTMNKEAETHMKETEQLQEDKHELLNFLLRQWAAHNSVEAEYLERDQCVLDDLQDLLMKIEQREQKVKEIHVKLQDEENGMASLLGKISTSQKKKFK